MGFNPPEEKFLSISAGIHPAGRENSSHETRKSVPRDEIIHLTRRKNPSHEMNSISGKITDSNQEEVVDATARAVHEPLGTLTCIIHNVSTS